ncbi:MAG: hypothetical protein Q9227_005418 [Pyrenula ochraceoflavens]
MGDNPNCDTQPEMTFVMAAMVNFGNYLNSISNSITKVAGVTTDKSGKMTEWFTRPGNDAGAAVAGLSVANGILGAISAVFPPAAVAGGTGGIIAGAIQLQADAADKSFQDFADYTNYLGDFQLDLQKTIDTYARHMFEDTPSNAYNYDYSSDPQGMPMILKDGGFASQVQVDSVPPSLLASYTSVGINYLWSKGDVFIVEISSDTFGDNACNLITKNNWCDGQKAHILLTWGYNVATSQGQSPQAEFTDVGTIPGLEHLGDDAFGGMKIEQVVRSSENAAKAGGKLDAKGMINGIINAVQGPPGAPASTTPDVNALNGYLTSFDRPVCDLDKILGDAKITKACKGGWKGGEKTDEPNTVS